MESEGLLGPTIHQSLVNLLSNPWKAISYHLYLTRPPFNDPNLQYDAPLGDVPAECVSTVVYLG